MELEDLVIVLSLGLLAAQILAWKWSRGIERALDGQIGADAMHILSGILGWTLIARIVGIIGLGVYDQTDSVTVALFASVVGQVIGGAVFLWATFKVRSLRDKAPVNGSGEAVMQGDAEPAG